jgi:carboxylesterase type B
MKGSAADIIAAQGQVNHTLSEDCLTLNVWTKPQTGEKKKAVLLWIHGGGKQRNIH